MEKITTFQELVEGCVEALRNGNVRDAEDIKQHKEQAYRVAKAIVDYQLSINKCAKCEWKQSKIMKFLNRTDVSVSQQVRIMRSPNLRVGSFYTNRELKAKIQAAYLQNGLNKKATGSQITDYYETSSRKPTVNGKQVRGYHILGEKLST